MPAGRAASIREAVFYHAVNLLKRGDHRALRKMRARAASWEHCWRAQAARLPWAFGGRDLDPEREWAALTRGGIGLVLSEDPGIPPLLREIPHPPFGIYFKGYLAAGRARWRPTHDRGARERFG